MKLSSDDLPIRRSPTTEMDCGLDAPMREKILETSRARPKNCAGSLIATRFRYGLRGISAANLPELDANPLVDSRYSRILLDSRASLPLSPLARSNATDGSTIEADQS